MSMLRRFTDFILRGRLQAMGVAFVCAYIPVIGSISILIAGLVTLRKSILDGALVLCAATAPFLLSYYASPPPSDQAGMAMLAIETIVAGNILVWLYAVLLRKYGNWNLILEISALLGVVVVGAVHFFNPDVQQWWSAQLTAYFTQAAVAMTDGLTSADTAMQLRAVSTIKPFATGLVSAAILCNGLIQLGLVRWWQTVLFAPGTLRQELYHIRFGYVAALLFVVVLLLSFWGNATALDIRPIFYSLFCIAGLSLVHCLLAPAKYTWFWLILFYVGSVIFFPKSIMAIAIFALLDVLLNVRRRLTRV